MSSPKSGSVETNTGGGSYFVGRPALGGTGGLIQRAYNQMPTAPYAQSGGNVQGESSVDQYVFERRNSLIDSTVGNYLATLSNRNASDSTSITTTGNDSVGSYNFNATVSYSYAESGQFNSNAPPIIGDASFEEVNVGYNGFVVGPTGDAWIFSNGGSAVCGNNSGLTNGNPNAPAGQQVAAIQNTGYFSQNVANWAAGNYTLSLDAADRGGYGGQDQILQVLVDGTSVGTITPVGTNYNGFTTPSFAVTAGAHTIEILGTATSGDSIALIDDIKVNLAPNPILPQGQRQLTC